MNRRKFLHLSVPGLLLASSTVRAQGLRMDRRLEGALGITTSSLDRHLSGGSEEGKINVMDLPKFLRRELDLTVLDLNSNTVGKIGRNHLDAFRKVAESAGCVLTNLKMNQSGLELGSADPELREQALKTYRGSMDDAVRLGLKWVRALPPNEVADRGQHVDGLRRLADEASRRKLTLLIENYGWLGGDALAAVRLIAELGRTVAASPDTGNWKDDEVRYAGLEQMFPLAVTCDFKARELGEDGSHAAYDLKRCFDAGWKAGFRGPWCFEHAHRDFDTNLRGLRLLRDRLRAWMDEARER